MHVTEPAIVYVVIGTLNNLFICMRACTTIRIWAHVPYIEAALNNLFGQLGTENANQFRDQFNIATELYSY